jgi:hypothetical protein
MTGRSPRGIKRRCRRDPDRFPGRACRP